MDSDGFWDRSHRLSYLLACENARRIRADPTVLDLGAAFLERFVRDDPRQAHGYALWRGILLKSPDEVAELLTERSGRGDYVRETAPAFGALPVAVRARLVREARTPLCAGPRPDRVAPAAR